MGGHETCPVAAGCSARWWPWDLPVGGHHGGVGQLWSVLALCPARAWVRRVDSPLVHRAHQPDRDRRDRPRCWLSSGDSGIDSAFDAVATEWDAEYGASEDERAEALDVVRGLIGQRPRRILSMPPQLPPYSKLPQPWPLKRSCAS